MLNYLRLKYKAISGHLIQHFGFEVSFDGTVSNVENIFCMHCEILKFNYLTKINYRIK